MNVNFDWNTMNDGVDPFEKKNTFAVDERFYVLKKDEQGNGAALIRFLPSEIHENGSMSTIKRVFRYNIKSKTSKRFISEWSPATIGLPDPIQEKWAQLYNSGQKEESRRYARSTRYLANIKVLKDPKAPENEGKIFLFDMSETLAKKIQSIIQPSENDLALGTQPKNLFDPLNGYSFKLVAGLGANGFTEYNQSDALPEKSSIYANVEEAVNDIKNNAYKLSDWDKPEAYKSYDEIKNALENLDNEVQEAKTSPATTVQTEMSAPFDIADNKPESKPANIAQQQKAQETKQATQVADNLDDLIAGLTN